jgi:hypothetical protein
MSTKNVELDGNTLPIREFDLEWFCPNPSICMIAKRGSGKSWVCRSILYHYRNIPAGVVIAPTDEMNTFYGKFFPELYIYYEYKSEIIEKLLHRQKLIIEKCKQKYKQGKKCDPRAFLVMDDCLSSKGSWVKDPAISKMFFDGRHYQCMYILTMQFPLGIKPELRCNFDYIFLLAEDFYSNQKRLYDHYAGMFPTFYAFRQVFLDITDDFGCMVIVNRGSRKSFLEKVFYFKAKKVNIDHILCKQFNDYNEDNYDKKWKNKEGINCEDILTKSKGSRIRISKQSLDSKKKYDTSDYNKKSVHGY